MSSLEIAILDAESRFNRGSSSTRSSGLPARVWAMRAFLESPALSSGWYWIRRV